MADLLQRSWQGTDEAHNHAHNAKDNGASSMGSDCIHHDGEREDMATHGEDEEEGLCGAEDFSPDSSGNDPTCVSHVVDMGVGELELSKYVASIGCNDTEAYDEYHAAKG